MAWLQEPTVGILIWSNIALKQGKRVMSRSKAKSMGSKSA